VLYRPCGILAACQEVEQLSPLVQLCTGQYLLREVPEARPLPGAERDGCAAHLERAHAALKYERN
jgi:hypothetical protein